MYWYYKYPFYAILVLILFGIGYLIYTHLPENVTESIENPIESAAGRGDNDSGQGASRQPPPRSTVQDPQVLRQLRSAERQLEEGNLLAARTLAQKAIESGLIETFQPEWRKAVEIISQVNTRFLNSNVPAPERVRHEVVSGDNLVTIAKKYNTTVGALQRSNPRLEPTNDKIFPGMIIHVYVGDWAIVVDKPHYVLMLMDGDKLFKLYDVAIGRQGRTPEGDFVVTTKIVEPDWTPPGKIIPYGDPENVLGTRWIGLKPVGDTDATLKGYGIHGTWEPESIGTQASQGCIRMRNEDVNELFDIVPRGIKVTIRGE